MSTSFIEKTRLAILKNSRRNQSAGIGGTIGIPIDRDGGLIEEIVLKITVSAAFAVAATSVDVRQFIERLNLRSNTGDLIKSVSGQQIYDMARLTERQATPVFTPGAGGGATGTVIYALELHHELDGAYFDSVSSLKTGDLSKLDLEVVVTNITKAGTIGFVGGTFAAVPAFLMSIDAEVYVRPEMAYRSDIGSQDHFLQAREDSGTVTGVRTIELDPSNWTRFITLHVDDISAGGGVNAAVPSDAIVGTIKMTQGSRILVDTDFRAARFATEQKRDKNITGFIALDWGDQNGAFCELDNSPVQLQYEILAGSPAWRVQVAQDYVRNKAEAV